jgi:hypothetical protein
MFSNSWRGLSIGLQATRSEREAAFRLRYNAYRRVGFLKPRPDNKLYDPLYDDDPMAWISMSFVDGELAGTVRVNVGTAENA